ncbi:MAG TPA: cytochrome c3 family protein [Pyrinomonadaceae bacterium]|jgi:predicted CXXCH cytochrome family protein|nr:cytochrome c3 family protein [Pyrinomonadaceae bacterium]
MEKQLAKLSLLIIAVVLLAASTATAQQKSSCIDCHVKLEGKIGDPARSIKDDIHLSRGLSCNDCHGGDPTQSDKTAAKDPRKGYLGRPRMADIPAFCGKCHNDASFMKKFNPALRVDQEKEYSTSVHGKLLKAGNQKVATCISCHGVHGIRAVSDALSSVYPLNVAETCAKCHGQAERMAEFKIPTDQYTKYKKSVHAKALYERQDLSAPTCNDCHGNHGAAPPGIASVANVCGQCHARQAELFQASVHKAAFDNKNLAECITCHNNHEIAAPTDALLGTAEGSVCITCHKPGEKGFAAAGEMRSQIDGLLARIDKSKGILDRAERAGMEVSKPKFDLREAIDGVTHARVLIHTSSPAEVDKVVAPAIDVTNKTFQAGVNALAELNYRRKGLVVSLFFILFLAVLVYLKLREIEGRQQA